MNLEIAHAAALGLGLGIVTGMPLGVVNLAIVDATVAGHRRFATGIGIGGALADATHAALAFIGVGQLLLRRPDLVRVLAIAAAVLIILYALIGSRRIPTKRVDATSPRAVLTGLLLTLLNPGALSAWVAVAALWPTTSLAAEITLAAGVGIGSAAWFALLAYVVSRVPREHRALRIIPKVAVVALVAIAVIGVVRVL